MASTLKVDQIETPSGVGNISFAQPISGDGSQLTGVGLAVGGGAVVAGDFLYHDGVEWTRLPKGTAAQYLRMNAGATAPEWIATTGAGIQEPAASAEGDILYYDGSNYVRLAKGTAGQQLAINAGATAPEWIAPATASSGVSQMICKQYGARASNNTDISAPGDTSYLSGYEWTAFTTVITPSSSSNYIWVTGSLSFGHHTNHCGMLWITYNHTGISETPVQGGTGLRPATYRIENFSSTTDLFSPIAVNLLFTPSTTNAVTIMVKTGSTNGGSYPIYLNTPSSQTTDAEDGITPMSTLTVMEIDNSISPSLTNTNINS